MNCNNALDKMMVSQLVTRVEGHINSLQCSVCWVY
jgi:hypothetical protein